MKKMMQTILATILLCACGLTLSYADQNSERLPVLFSILQESDNIYEVRETERQIWLVWLDSGREDINELMQQGTQAMQTRDLDTALEKFDKIVELAPDFAEGWNKRATVYYLRDQLNESMLDVQRTLELEPRHFGALSGIGLIFMEIGDTEGAIKAFEEVLKVHPNAPGTKENLKRLREKKKKRVI